jgi:hypothetical protein
VQREAVDQAAQQRRAVSSMMDIRAVLQAVRRVRQAAFQVMNDATQFTAAFRWYWATGTAAGAADGRAAAHPLAALFDQSLAVRRHPGAHPHKTRHRHHLHHVTWNITTHLCRVGCMHHRLAARMSCRHAEDAVALHSACLAGQDSDPLTHPDALWIHAHPDALWFHPQDAQLTCGGT